MELQSVSLQTLRQQWFAGVHTDWQTVPHPLKGHPLKGSPSEELTGQKVQKGVLGRSEDEGSDEGKGEEQQGGRDGLLIAEVVEEVQVGQDLEQEGLEQVGLELEEDLGQGLEQLGWGAEALVVQEEKEPEQEKEDPRERRRKMGQWKEAVARRK